MKEIFAQRQWIKFDWARKMKFTFERDGFTCSFSTMPPTEKQKEVYGEYVYGYQSDIVGQSITTLLKTKNLKSEKTSAMFSQFLVYDVLYSREEFKEEMNYLFSVIDDFYLSEDEKCDFLENIIDYWKLSIKDRKWEYENERRFEILHFDEYEYVDGLVDDVFLKNKTDAMICPDFICGENHMKNRLMANIKKRAYSIYFGEPFKTCSSCLQTLWAYDTKRICPICGSELFNFNELNK